MTVSNELRKTQVATVPLAECNATLLQYNTLADLKSFRDGISNGQYCAYDSNGKNDSCQGDSGGPLQIVSPASKSAKIVGIVSFGVSCGAKLPSIYTRVAFYLDWIESHVWPNGIITLRKN